MLLSCTICSGSLAERCEIHGYIGYVLVMTGIIYPMACFWIWNSNGPMSPGKNLGAIDFAGSGVVHLLGGIAGLVGSIILGPRIGRFGNHAIKPSGHSAPLSIMGTFILWFGWYSFNSGSIFGYRSENIGSIYSRIAVTTTLSACCAALASCVLCKIRRNYYDLESILNCILSGLVGITGSCATVEPYWACLIGILSAVVYEASSEMMEYFRIDDPLDCAQIHGFCGIWGLINVGLFSNERMIREIYVDASDEWLARSWGERLWPQILAALILSFWSAFTSIVTFKSIDMIWGLRVSREVEKKGLDCQHGTSGWLIVASRVDGSASLDNDPLDNPIHVKTRRSTVRQARFSTSANGGSDAQMMRARSDPTNRRSTVTQRRPSLRRAFSVDDAFRNDTQAMVMTDDATAQTPVMQSGRFYFE